MAQAETYTIVLKDHAFVPSEIKIPANQKVTLIVLPYSLYDNDIPKVKNLNYLHALYIFPNLL